MRRMGGLIVQQLNTEVGKDISIDTLLTDYDAVFLGVGTYKNMRAGLENENATGVYDALPFLISNTYRVILTQFSTNELRVQYTISFLKDKAQRVIEPILRDYIYNLLYARKQITTYIYEKYKNFKKELTYTFGIANKKQEAKAKIC